MPTGADVPSGTRKFERRSRHFAAAAANEVWTLARRTRCRTSLIHFDHQVRQLEIQVVNAATGLPVHPVFSNAVERGLPAAEPARATGVLRVPVGRDADARQRQGSKADHRKTVPDGQYKIVARALKALGDPANPAHWETRTSSTITIDRP